MQSSSEERLPAGKLPPPLLARLLQKLPVQHAQLLLGPAVGEDAAVIEWDRKAERLLIAKSDPITFATDEIGYYAVNVCANDLAVTGATPIFYLPTVLLPATTATASQAETIFQQIADACGRLGIVVAGGHSEITPSVTQPIIAGTMLGEATRSNVISSAGARPGHLIVMAGEAPIEGVSIIAREMRAALLARGWHERELDEAALYLYQPGISVMEPALLAAQTGIVSAMHDPTEGGMITGLHELAAAAQVGLEVTLEAIPIPELATRLCRVFDLDPLGTIASGALLATVPEDYVQTVLSIWTAHQWPASVIGRITEASEGIIGIHNGIRQPLQLFPADEITKLWA
ncbi:MAG: AIR synthase-related protein [Caldilineaceae bacterium]